MLNRKYKIKRNSIYVGAVVKTDRIYRNDEKDPQAGLLDTGAWEHLRTILFTLDNNMFANDLLYQTKAYPVLNITSDDICLRLDDDSILIKEVCNLDGLLEYFGYAEELNYKDIVSIRKIFFDGKFAKNYCELFGYKRFKNNNTVIYQYNEEGILSDEYWMALNDLGNSSIKDVLGHYSQRVNAFKPHKEEGKVKKLVRN